MMMTKSIRGRRGFDLVGALSNASVSLARSPEGSFFVVATTVVVMVVQRLFLLLALRERRERERGERESQLLGLAEYTPGRYVYSM